MTGGTIEAMIEEGLGNQLAAANPRVSAWVSASAGAGKTHVLANRVLRLMLAGARPEGILCLTYTKVAASEMANRIFDRLARWAAADDAELVSSLAELAGKSPDPAMLARARQLFADVLDLPGGLRIQTIHAFCQSLLARFPIEAGIGANSRIVDDRTAREILADARDRTLLLALDGEQPTPLARAVARLAERGGETVIRSVIGDLFDHRTRLRRAVEASITADHAARAVTDRLLGQPAVEGPDIGALRLAIAVLSSGSKTDHERAARIGEWLDRGAPGQGAEFDTYALAYLTTTGTVRQKLATDAVAKVHPAAIEALGAEAARVFRALKDHHARISADVSGALIRLGDAMHQAYQERKRWQGALDYDDLIALTERLLDGSDIGWVHYKLDGGIDHILIDEAQDTSPEQWRIITALAADFFAGEGGRDEALGDAPARTVFAVGDVKQSIFSFQGAEPAGFRGRERGFEKAVLAAGREWKDVPLNLSFRSAPEILALVDRVFAVAGADDGVAFDQGSISHAARRHDQAGRVELWPVETAGAKSKQEAWAFPLALRDAALPEVTLARRIAATIKGWIGREDLPSRGRTVRPGDVLILVRRRNAFFRAMVQALKAQGVPVAGSDRMVLTDEIAVRDLMAAGAFALLPEDSLNLASLLKSPLVGFDEDQLFQLAAERRQAILWHELEARRTESALFGDAHARLAQLLARADFVPPFEFFASLLNEGGGRARLAARLGPDVNDPIDEFLSLALAYERLHPPSLQGFLSWLAQGSAEVKRDQGEARDEVRVMTVHGAKGLEAPIVFLPDTCSLPQDRNAILWIANDAHDAELPIWPAPGKPVSDPVEAARTRAREAELREYRRLLYVALTRAEDRLYVCGWQGSSQNAGATPSWYQLVEVAFADWPEAKTAETAFGPVLRVDGKRKAQPDKRGVSAGAAMGSITVPAALAGPPPAEPEVATPLAPSRIDDEPPGSSPRAGLGTAAGQRGRLIHRLLQWLPALPVPDREKAALRYLGRPLFGLDPQARKDLLDAVLAVLATPDFAPLFGPASRAEVPIIGRAGDNGRFVVSGQVDRLVVLPDRVLIVDYKTNRKPPKSADAIPVPYLRQMAAYRAVLGQALPGRAVRCALVWTEGPKMMPVPPDLLDRYAP
ncbi:MAG: double-strand break repair helicase AddA [Alphaproteobacteria bacterium]